MRHHETEADKRHVAADKLFAMADDQADRPRAHRMIQAGYRVLRRAMALDQSISFGAPYPGWKALQAFYRKRLEAMCAERPEEKAARKALQVAQRELAHTCWRRAPEQRANVRQAAAKYALVTGMTLRRAREGRVYARLSSPGT